MSLYRNFTLKPKLRVFFNPKDKKHVLEYANFLKNRGWKDGCPFFLEDPYTDIPTMIQSKISEYVALHMLASNKNS